MFIAFGVLKNNSLTLMNRRSLIVEKSKLVNRNIEKLKNTLEKVNYLCTTADVWSAKEKALWV